MKTYFFCCYCFILWCSGITSCGTQENDIVLRNEDLYIHSKFLNFCSLSQPLKDYIFRRKGMKKTWLHFCKLISMNLWCLSLDQNQFFLVLFVCFVNPCILDAAYNLLEPIAILIGILVFSLTGPVSWILLLWVDIDTEFTILTQEIKNYKIWTSLSIRYYRRLLYSMQVEESFHMLWHFSQVISI